MRFRWLILLVLTICTSAQAAGISGKVHFLGIALNQVGRAGAWTQVGHAGDWQATIAGTILNNKMYTAESSGKLFVTDLNTGVWQQLGKPDFADTAFMFSAGQSLYTIEHNGNLFRVDPTNGGWVQLGAAGDWKATVGCAVLNDNLYSAESDGGLFCTDLTNGTWRKIGANDFANTQFMFTSGNSLYTIETDGTLFRVSPETGGWSPVGKAGQWKDVVGACILGGRLYAAEKNGKLYAGNLQTGIRGAVGSPDFAATHFMFPSAGHLFTIEDNGNLFHIEARASDVIDQFDCFPNEFERIFRDQGKGLSAGFESKKITGAKASHAAILDGFAWLDRECKPDDLAVVYLTAHGGTDPKTGWAIVTADSKLLYGREIKAELAKVRCPVLFLLETCGCGGFAEVHENDPPVPANVIALCACTATESTDNPLDIAVSEALYGRADFNGDGVIEVDELVRYLGLRYKEWWPKVGAGTNEPVIARGRSSGAIPLTHVSKSLIAVAVGDDYWSALEQSAEGDHFKIHLLGWPGDPGKAYFITDTATREHICLNGDGNPVQVENNGHWRAARLVKAGGKEIAVHYIDEHPGDETVTVGRVRYPFAGNGR